jgi:hypothetical protein
VDARQPADVAGDDAVHREQDGRRRQPLGGPERVAIADAVRPVADGIADATSTGAGRIELTNA